MDVVCSSHVSLLLICSCGSFSFFVFLDSLFYEVFWVVVVAFVAAFVARVPAVHYIELNIECHSNDATTESNEWIGVESGLRRL